MFIVKAIFIIGVVTKIHEGVPLFSPCKKELSTGDVSFFCCDNHEEKDGRCIECQIGYKSIDGNPCLECPQGFYGRKCNTKCYCHANQRCNHIKGCTDQLAGVGNISTEHIPNFKEITEVKIYTKINTWKTDETTKQVFTENHNKNIHFIILYIMIALAVVGFCSKGNRIWMCKRKREGHSNQPMQGQSHQLVQQNRSAEYIDVIDENEYESIEDVSTDNEAMLTGVNDIDGNNIFVDNSQNSTSSNSNESVRVIVDGYLTPYEPLNEYIEKHDYKKIEPKVDILFGKEDTSSDSDKNSTDSSGYLKPVRIEETVI